MPRDPEEEAKKFDEEIEEIETKKTEEVLSHQEIRDQLIAEIEKQTKTYKIGSIEVKLRAGLPVKLRKTIISLGTKFKKTEMNPKLMDEVINEAYVLLSQVSVDAPFNDPKTWKDIDNKTGVVPEMMMSIMDMYFKDEEAIKCFRKK